MTESRFGAGGIAIHCYGGSVTAQTELSRAFFQTRIFGSRNVQAAIAEGEAA